MDNEVREYLVSNCNLLARGVCTTARCIKDGKSVGVDAYCVYIKIFNSLNVLERMLRYASCHSME